MDHNIDWHGDDEPREELNLLERGKKYGWPYVLADGFLNPQDDPPGDITLEAWAAASEKPQLTYTAHAAPMQMAFYTAGSFPAEYRGNAFVAMRGSWNRKPPSGYEVVRIVFDNGKPVRIEPFLGGFLSESGGSFTRTARLAGLAVAKDGALLVSDDENGVIYRIAYTGPATATDAVAAQAPVAAQDIAPAIAPKPVAIDALDARNSAKLEVRSPAFEVAGAIPLRYSDYGGKLSPPLSWSRGPTATKSYVVIVDDPDAKPQLVNHWGIFNLPADVVSLPEGIPGAPALAQPKALQATNTRGSTGYVGPRPPPGDAPHAYHFQVFALDRELDLPPAPARELVLEAMRGHVLAAGTLIGTFQRDSAVQKAVDAATDLH